MLGLERPPLLFGWDSTPGLVAFEPGAAGSAIRVYRRTGDTVLSEHVPFAPFLLVADRSLVRKDSTLVEEVALDGAGELRWLLRFASWPAALAARDRCRDASGQAPGSSAAPYHFFADPVHQYLLLTGRTSFGGLAYADLVRMAVDIEVLTTEGFEFPSAARPGDRVIAVALADTRGFRHVVRGDRLDEAALLAECSRLVRERDPDVIEGHNVFRFDLEYLHARARLHGLSLDWGRDGSALRAWPSRVQVGDRSLAFRRWHAAGRHVVDTWILAQLHDAGTRDLPGFGLKDLARHLGVAAPERTYVDPAQIPREFRDRPDRLMAYAGDDAAETLRVSEIFSPPYFAQAQLLPFDYESTVLRGTARKIDALLLRDRLRRRGAVPAPRAVVPVGGGRVTLPMRGVARPVLHVDVTSLYPSLMVERGIAPSTDADGTFLALLRHLRELRVRAKRLAAESGEAQARAHLQALQQSFKVLINAFYGYLAFPGGHWNDAEAANRVTAEGRAALAAILDRLGALGATPVEADTDGAYFVPPRDHSPGDDAHLLACIADALPPGLQLELDRRYAAMLSYKLKNYALLDERGQVTLRGSAFRSRGLEPFQREIVDTVVRLLLAGRGADVKAVVERWLTDFAFHRVPVRRFARTETLADTLEEYRAQVEAGRRSAAAAYEVARASGRTLIPGDQVSYYVTGRGAGVPVTECARLASLWDPVRPDENVEYYQARVLDIAERFRPFVERDGLWPADDDGPSTGPVQLPLL